MPTGYTAGIGNGSITSFGQYAKNCARAFGAFIHLRDDPNAPLTDKIEPDSYYTRRIYELEKELSDFQSKSEKDLVDEFNIYKSDTINRISKSIEEDLILQNKYEAMLALAKQFKAPTPQHEEYAKFIVKQLESSISFDCDTSGYNTKRLKEVNELTYEVWYSDKLYQLKSNLDFNKNKASEAINMASSKTEWIQLLFAEIDRVDNALQTNS